MPRKMPVGVDDFKKLVESKYYFADKTHFIKELLDKSAEVTLITRPRRFGKTLNLSMLYYFFNIENAAQNRELFNGLHIEQAGGEYVQEQGTRPVIFFTFKDIKQRTWQSETEKIANILSALYREYLFLADSPRLTEIDRENFCAIYKKNASLTDMEDAVFNLCRMLATHYGKKPVLLLDEYDTPIISAWHNHYYDDCITFMRNFFGAALKNNLYLDFAVLTGITRVSKESIFSGLNNLDVCSVLSDFYADCFGFTPADAEKLLTDCGLADKMPELRQWYDGYNFGGQEIYNPWSVINFVHKGCKFQPYWINVSDNAILKDVLRHVDLRRREELEKLLVGKTVKSTVNENIVYADLATNRDSLYMLLLYTGYLKAVSVRETVGDMELVNLQIPNYEVRRAYKQEILQYVVPRQGITLLHEMLNAMISGNTEEFADRLGTLLKDYISYNDTARNPECFYHGLLLGLSVLMEGEYRIESNRESGYGRFDMAFFPLVQATPGVIWEIKTAKSENELEQAAQTALMQIDAKDYANELKRQGIADIWRYGVAICGKNVTIRGKID